MTRRSILEYAQALRPRYRKASKEEKRKMLDEFTKVTGLHRKAAIRLLNRVSRLITGKRRGRQRKYGSELTGALKEVWEASDRLCSKRLKPFIPEMVKVLTRHGEQWISASLEAQLCHISPSTIDRLLRPCRKLGGRKPLSTTKPGSLLKNAIPIRTFADWKEDQPGFMGTDLVAHCGDIESGFALKADKRQPGKVMAAGRAPLLGNRNYEATRRASITVLFDAIRLVVASPTKLRLSTKNDGIVYGGA